MVSALASHDDPLVLCQRRVLPRRLRPRVVNAQGAFERVGQTRLGAEGISLGQGAVEMAQAAHGVTGVLGGLLGRVGGGGLDDSWRVERCRFTIEHWR